MDKIKKPSDREQFSLRIDLDFKNELELLAIKNNTSLNDYIYRILKKEINQL